MPDRGWQLHVATGLRPASSVYASIDDDRIHGSTWPAVPALPGWERVLGRRRGGVHAHSESVERALQDGIGTCSRQRNRARRNGDVSGRSYPAGRDRQPRSRRHGRAYRPHPQPPARGVGQNLPISNNCQQTNFVAAGHRVDTFEGCVRSWASFPAPRGVAENTKFLDNDFITASR